MINCLRTKEGNVWRRDWLTATTTIFIESRTWTRITWREFVNLAQNLPVLVRDYWYGRIVEGHVYNGEGHTRTVDWTKKAEPQLEAVRNKLRSLTNQEVVKPIKKESD
nr:hypothetical protein Iba_chr08aCG7930 [Ipomoea batatas]